MGFIILFFFTNTIYRKLFYISKQFKLISMRLTKFTSFLLTLFITYYQLISTIPTFQAQPK